MEKFGLCVIWSAKVEILAPDRHQVQWSWDLRKGPKVQEIKIWKRASFPNFCISLFSLSLQGDKSNSFTLTWPQSLPIPDSEMDPAVLCSFLLKSQHRPYFHWPPDPVVPSQVTLRDSLNQAGLTVSICKTSRLGWVVSTALLISNILWFYSRLGILGLSRELS